MLPSNFNLNKTIEDRLKVLKLRTGISPNVSSRFAFFRSISLDFKAENWNDYVTDGTLRLDKLTWLGSTQLVTETILKSLYPRVTNPAELHRIWAIHVEHGSAAFHNKHELTDFITEIVS